MLNSKMVTLMAWLLTSAFALLQTLPTNFIRVFSWNPLPPPSLTPNWGMRVSKSCNLPATFRQAAWVVTGSQKASSMPGMSTSRLWASHRIVSELESLMRLLLSPSLFSKIGRMSVTRALTLRLPAPDAQFSMRALNTYA